MVRGFPVVLLACAVIAGCAPSGPRPDVAAKGDAPATVGASARGAAAARKADCTAVYKAFRFSDGTARYTTGTPMTEEERDKMAGELSEIIQAAERLELTTPELEKPVKALYRWTLKQSRLLQTPPPPSAPPAPAPKTAEERRKAVLAKIADEGFEELMPRSKVVDSAALAKHALTFEKKHKEWADLCFKDIDFGP